MKKSELRQIIREVIQEQQRMRPSMGKSRRPTNMPSRRPANMPSLKGLKDTRNLERILKSHKTELEFTQWYNSTILPYSQLGVRIPTAQQLINSIEGMQSGTGELNEWIKIVRGIGKIIRAIITVVEAVSSFCCGQNIDWCCGDL